MALSLPDPPLDERRAGRPLILVVDDHRANVELLEAYLDEIGCEVESASSGLGALAAVRARRPDLVLLDVMLPGMDGFHICAALKNEPATRLLPIILVTALDQPEDRVQGLEVGADDFIVKPVQRIELTARVRSLLRLKAVYDRLDDAERVIIALARAVEAKDFHTEGHTERVGHAARRLGIAGGLRGPILEDLYWGGVIHDIGKIGVPDAILQKPGPLAADELEVMRRHVLIGEEIARPLHSAANLLPIIRHHHERIDGGGYPDRLARDLIPISARVVSICDAFDAMVSDRPYRPGLTPHRAGAILREGAGRQWDERLTGLFLEQVGL
ncbi:MAG: HD-GYP domain-containing protein [Candidatus Dormibacteraceae bacterium]